MKKLLIACIIVSAIVLNACKQKKEIFYTPREITVSADVPKTKLPLERMDLECFGVHDIVAVDSMIVLFTIRVRSSLTPFGRQRTNPSRMAILMRITTDC